MADFLINKDANEALSLQEFVGGAISGTGTANYIPKFSAVSTIIDSLIYQDPVFGFIGINNTAPNSNLHIGNESILGTYTSGGSSPEYSLPKSLFTASTNLSPGEQVVGGVFISQLTGTELGETVGLLSSTYNDSGGSAIGIVSLIENEIDSVDNLESAIGVLVDIRNYGTDGYIDTVFGIKVSVDNSSSNNNVLAYGIYIADIDADTGFGIYQNGSENNFLNGNLKLGSGPTASVEAMERLHLSPGSNLVVSLANPSPSLAQVITGGATYIAGDNIQYKVSVLDHKNDEVLSSTTPSITLTGSNNSVQVSWSAVPGAMYYRVYRNVNGGGWNDYVLVQSNVVVLVDTNGLTYVAGSLPASNEGYQHYLSGSSDDSYIGSDLRVRDDFKIGGNVYKSNPTSTNSTLVIFEQGTGGIQLAATSLVPDSIGAHCLDFQIYRTSSSQVAGAPYSSIFGGSKNTISGLSNSSCILGSNMSSITGSFLSCIVGSLNSVVSAGLGNMICGGGYSTVSAGNLNFVTGFTHSVSGNYTLTSGNTNTNSGDCSGVLGKDNNVSGNYSLCSGRYNTVSGNYSSCSGYNNSISGNNSVISGLACNITGDFSFASGNNCIVTGNNSLAVGDSCSSSSDNSFSHGIGANISHISEYAHGNSDNISLGVLQFTRSILKRNTTNDTPTLLTLTGDEVTSGFRYTIQNEKTYGMTVYIVGRQTGGTAHAYMIRNLLIQNTLGTTSIIGSVANTLDINPTSWTVDITADDTNEALSVMVTGGATDDIEWIAVIEAVEIFNS